MINNKSNHRPQEILTLLNPAFCALLIHAGMIEFNKIQKDKIPYIFPFVMLPLVLHKKTRSLLPRTSNTTFFNWVTNKRNVIVKINFAQRARSMAPFIREALCFGVQQKLFIFNSSAQFSPNANAPSLKQDELTDDIKECIKSAALCSRLMAKAGDIKTIMILLGVKP